MEYTMSSPTMEAPVQSSVQYAGFWKRFWASLIDGLVLGAVCGVVALIGGVSMFGFHNNMNNPAAASAAMSGFFMILLVEAAGGWLYFALMESSSNQGTLGKMALGLRVTGLDGRRISFGKATGRYFGKILSGMTLCIGYIMAGFTQKKQALHDFVAGTLVLTKQSSVPAQVAQNAFAGI
ncbi:MAG TPA: RDD family protein [Candidatus Kapabacteria bacterium]|jgi:uncharacterized RDD family membrane protein YckC